MTAGDIVAHYQRRTIGIRRMATESRPTSPPLHKERARADAPHPEAATGASYVHCWSMVVTEATAMTHALQRSGSMAGSLE